MHKKLTKKLQHYHKRAWQVILVAMGVVGGLLGIVLVAGYYFSPQLVKYKPEIIQALSDALDYPVTVGNLTTSWEGFGPLIELKDVQIWDKAQKSSFIFVENAEVKISIFNLIKKQKIVPASITLDQVRADLLQQPNGKIELVGLDASSQDSVSDIYEVFDEITDQGDIEITHADLNLRLASGENIYLKDIELLIGRKFGKGFIDVSGELNDNQPMGKFNISTTVDLKMLANQQLQGEATVGLTQAELVKWERLWPNPSELPATIKSGKGDVEFTFNWRANTLSRVESIFALQQLSIEWTEKDDVNQTSTDHSKNTAAKPSSEIRTFEVISVSGKGFAKHDGRGWFVVGNSFVKPITGGSLRANGNVLVTPDIENTEVDLYVHADDVPGIPTLEMALKEIGKYLPDALATWLKAAIIKGDITEADLVLQGPLKDFPYDKAPGNFEVNADIVDATLKFLPDWGPVNIDQGKINFKRDTFYSVIQKGSIGKGKIIEGAVIIPELKKEGSEIKVTGIMSGSAEDSIIYLKNTPLWEELKDQLEPLVLEGPIQLDLNVDVFLDIQGQDKIVGAITFQDNKVNMPQWDLAFSEVEGKMTFDNKGIYSNNITGKLYQQPIQAQFATQYPANEPSFLKIALQGELNMQSVKKYYPNPLWNDWSGKTTYTSDIELHDATDATPSHIVVNSDLKGLAVNLPAPFNKSAQKVEPFLFDLKFGPAIKHLQFKYDAAIRADLYGNQASDNFNKGMVEINPDDINSPLQVPDQGIQVIGTLPTLDLDSWIDRMQSGLQGKSSVALPTITGKMKVDSVLFMKKNLSIQTINFQRLPQEWKVGFGGKDAQGQVTIPHDLSTQAISLYLDSIAWETSENKEIGNPPPDNFPNINVDIKNLTLNNKEIGEIQFSTKMGQHSMTVSPLNVINRDYTLGAVAYWDWSTTPGKTSLKGTIITENLGGMLKAWDISGGMQGGKGSSKIDLEWVGGPAAWDVNALQGEVILDWKNGRLVDVKPGLGRILSLFSVDAKSIAQRLTLNFNDLFKKGFTFELLSSDLIFNKGTINIKNGEVDSSSGKILFRGNAYTIPKTLDVYLDVYPALSNSSSAIAAGLAIVNPIAGAAMWAANKALSPATDKLISMRYHVTGSFEDPVITPLHGKNSKNTSKQ